MSQEEPKQEQWGWWAEEEVHGPFDSREEAIADAEEDGVGEFSVAMVLWLKAEDAVCDAIDADFVLDRTNEEILDSNPSDITYGPMSFLNKDEAARELEALLRAWARKHCRMIFFVMDGDTEERFGQ